jgi:predicted extracellular nuclease
MTLSSRGTLGILKNTGLTDLVGTLPPEERYTYVFEGNSQVLDHIMRIEVAEHEDDLFRTPKN